MTTVEISTADEVNRWAKKFFFGDPIELTEDKFRVTDVCSTAAIYEIQRSYNKRETVEVNGKPYTRIIRSDKRLAKCDNWVKPDESFLNECY